MKEGEREQERRKEGKEEGEKERMRKKSSKRSLRGRVVSILSTFGTDEKIRRDGIDQ